MTDGIYTSTGIGWQLFSVRTQMNRNIGHLMSIGLLRMTKCIELFHFIYAD